VLADGGCQTAGQGDTMSDAARAGSSTGTLLVSLFFIVAGIVTLYDTTTYTDVDSKVFPRAAAILLILAATISLVTDLVRGARESGFGNGDWWRRLLLVGAMLACCLAMPLTGFLPAAAIAFLGALVAAMHQRWTARHVLIYGVSGAVLMGGFYALFRYGLNVPLP